MIFTILMKLTTFFQDIAQTLVKFEQLPHFLEIFSSSDPPSSAATPAGGPTSAAQSAQTLSATNGAASGSDSDSSKSDLLNNNNNRKDGDAKLVPGDIRISGRTYSVTDSAHLFLSILVCFEYRMLLQFNQFLLRL